MTFCFPVFHTATALALRACVEPLRMLLFYVVVFVFGLRALQGLNPDRPALNFALATLVAQAPLLRRYAVSV